nr:MAG TPA: hypothetical protein [Bacteriophage sp.]
MFYINLAHLIYDINDIEFLHILSFHLETNSVKLLYNRAQ